jgi:hypothetical protein
VPPESLSTRHWFGTVRLPRGKIRAGAQQPGREDVPVGESNGEFVSSILLVPSVWEKPFGRVAAEAMINAIPRDGTIEERYGIALPLFDEP